MPQPRQARDDDDATIVPFRTRRQSTPDTWHVERIDIEPMTPAQHDAAVTALAALINQWQEDRENATKPQDKAA